jgi:hypothetical protein
MNNFGLFMQFGVRAAGGPAFLRRERTAFSYIQRQRQDSTGQNFSQLQQRNGTGFTFTDTGFEWVCNDYYPVYDGITYQYGTGCTSNPFCYGCGYNNCSGWGICDQFYRSANATTCQNKGNNIFSISCNQPSHVGNIRFQHSYQGSSCAYCCEYIADRCQSYSRQACGINWGDWFNVSTCSANTSCSNGSSNRECRTLTGCNFNITQPFYNVASCTVSTPTCTTGAARIECRDVTMYDWNPFSPYEEVDVCVPQSPAPGPGAVQIECVPQ